MLNSWMLQRQTADRNCPSPRSLVIKAQNDWSGDLKLQSIAVANFSIVYSLITT